MTSFAQRRRGVDAAAGEQRGVDFEGGVFGGGADEADAAALDVGQEGVLLGLVEAMDLVDEEDGARAVGGGLFGVDHDLLDLLDAGEDGGELDEAGVGEVAMILARVVLPVPGGPQKIMRWGRRFRLRDAAACRGRAGAPGRRTRRGCGGACARRAEWWRGGWRRGERRCVEEAHALVAGWVGCSLAGGFVEQERAGDGGVEAFDAGAGDGDADGRRGRAVRGEAGAFVADEQGVGPGKVGFVGGDDVVGVFRRDGGV
jgi:hypothetical protein